MRHQRIKTPSETTIIIAKRPTKAAVSLVSAGWTKTSVRGIDSAEGLGGGVVDGVTLRLTICDVDDALYRPVRGDRTGICEGCLDGCGTGDLVCKSDLVAVAIAIKVKRRAFIICFCISYGA